MVLPTNIAIRLTSNAQHLSILQTTYWLIQQQQMHLLHMTLTLIHWLITTTDSVLRGNVKLQRHMLLRCLYVTEYLGVVWLSYLHTLFLFALQVMRWNGTAILPLISQHLVPNYKGKNGCGVFYSKNPLKIFGSKMTQQESVEMAQWAWVIG